MTKSLIKDTERYLTMGFTSIYLHLDNTFRVLQGIFYRAVIPNSYNIFSARSGIHKHTVVCKKTESRRNEI